MEFSLSHSSSLRCSALKPAQKSSSHQAKIPIKPRGKLCCFSSKCSLNFPSTKLRSHKSHSRVFSPENESYPKLMPNKSSGCKRIPLIKANSQVRGEKFQAGSPLEKVLDFGEVVVQFIRRQSIRGSIIAFAINKPYLPIVSGRLSVQSAWWLVISFVAISILIAGVGLNSIWFVAFLVFEYLAGSAYSISPIRLKSSTIGAILTCGTMRGYAFTLTIAAAARATLDLTFQFSLPVIFLSIIATLIFLAQGVIKDLPDLEGDIKNNIPTLASIIGARKAAFIGHVFLIHAYACAILTAISFPQVFRVSVMIPVHAILGLCFLFKAWKLEKSNYSKEESTTFDEFIFKLFDLEFLIFPFI